MTRYELLKLNESLLLTLYSNGIGVKEVNNIAIYDKYRKLLADGNKVTYIVSHLSETFGLKERAIYALVKRFEMDVIV